MLNYILGIIIFFTTFLLYHIIASPLFPVSEDGYLVAPPSYALVGICLAFAVAVVFVTFKRKSHSSRQRSVSTSEDDFSPICSSDTLAENTTDLPTDELIDAAAMVIFDTEQPSISMLQRRLHLPYSSAASCMDQLEHLGVVGPYNGTNLRKILITKDTYLASRGRLASTHTFTQHDNIDNTLLRIDSMEGHEFEYWCADLLRKLGYVNVEVTPGSGDQGVDVLAEKEDIKYAIQCKCYSSDLGNTPVQEVHAGKAMYNCHIGVVMTNRHFTVGGQQLAKATGVLLWDRDWIIEALTKLSPPSLPSLDNIIMNAESRKPPSPRPAGSDPVRTRSERDRW